MVASIDGYALVTGAGTADSPFLFSVALAHSVNQEAGSEEPAPWSLLDRVLPGCYLPISTVPPRRQLPMKAAK